MKPLIFYLGIGINQILPTSLSLDPPRKRETPASIFFKK
jgi:hypothetical protein